MIYATKNLFVALWKKRIVFCLMLFTICNGLFLMEIQAQSFNLPNPAFCNQFTTECLTDETQEIRTVPQWEAYQTLDNTWNGERDSSSCFNYGQEGNNCGIEVFLSEINPEKSLFIRCELDETNKVILQGNMVYALFGEEGDDFNIPIWGDENVLFNTSDTCANDLCSGLYVHVQIPNEIGDGFDTRTYTSSLESFELGNLCFPTERFEGGNFLREVIFKFTFTDFAPDSYLSLYSIFLDNAFLAWGGASYETIMANEYNPVTQHHELQLNFWNRNHLLLYTAPTYPKAGNPSYVDVFPSESAESVDTIDVIVPAGVNLLAQPYTFLRGGLVSETGTLRHQFNLLQQGGDLCFFATWIELVFEDGNQYHYKSGKVDLQGKNACMQFGKGSSLNVEDGATLEYGKNGRGMLMLRSGGGIEIGQDAELIVGNKLMMQEYANDVPQQIYMTLNKGSRLTFTETARISNEYSINQAMRLNVYMKGGILDDSALDAQSRALINRIYDTPAKAMADNLVIYQNPLPSGIPLQWSYIFQEKETTQTQLFDLTGRLVYQNTLEAQQGINYFTLPTNDLQSGTYFLSVLVEGKMVTKKVVIY